ncbi:MAG TPA: SBBP repeat-containing protein [Candidatus Nitrosocosmicus sp.]|nr:SBBP repeat-containing protein [Candidatus Nitrosocosmicus sp.]
MLSLSFFTSSIWHSIAESNKTNHPFIKPPKPEEYSFVEKWGSKGANDGQFNHPSGIAVDSLGNVYVVDFGNHRIQKFTSDGKFIIKWGSKAGTLFRGKEQFNSPKGIAIDSLNIVYVTDDALIRIQLFLFNMSGMIISVWGPASYGTRYFLFPSGIAVDSLGNVYVVDSGNHRIRKYDSNGKFITNWGSKGTGDGRFEYPLDIAIDSSSGDVYVSDPPNYCIQKFDCNGKFITKWGSYGSENGQFNHPSGIAIDSSSNNVYVADTYNNRIQVFAPAK